MADNEYEILPHQLLEDLKFDVEALKKKLSEPEAKANELILEIETLKDSIHELNSVFSKALDETKEEDVYHSIKTLNERIDAVVTQNETIAKGMIAISDKVDEFLRKQKEGNAGPMTSQLPGGPAGSSFGTPGSFGSGPSAPMPPSPGLQAGANMQHQFMGSPQGFSGGRTPVMPPPPIPQRKKRKGLF